MSELRWILIGFGIVLLAGIYLWGRRSGTAVGEDVALRSRPEPSLQPQGFTDARREPALHREDAHSYDEPDHDDEPLEEHGDDAVDDAVDEPSAIDYETTAVRPARTLTKDAPAATNDEPPRPVPDYRRGRMEPTIGVGESITEELPVEPASASPPAPTLSSSETPAPRRPERRKILSLRLSLAPQRVEGAKLQEVLQEELLSHGKYDVFHRLHSDGQSIFSIASMVEPGTFDVEKMSETLYPGVTLFAQLPGPVPGMHALNELVACARRLHQSLGGVLQDDRGVPLTVHRIERMRQEVREFERPPSANTRTMGGRSEGYQE